LVHEDALQNYAKKQERVHIARFFNGKRKINVSKGEIKQKLYNHEHMLTETINGAKT